MTSEFFKIMLEQSFIGAFLFVIVMALDIFTQKHRLGQWRSFFWLSFFAFLVFPFQKVLGLLPSNNIPNFKFVNISGESLSVGKQMTAALPMSYSLSQLLFIIWTVGFCVALMALIIIPFVKEKRLIKSLALGDDSALKSHHLPFDVSVVESKVLPFVSGVLNPRIFVPQEMFKHFSQNEVRGILFHEMAHILHKDVFKIFFSRIVTCIFWFFPLSYFAASKLRDSLEYRADEFALRKDQTLVRADFAKTLFKLSNFNETEAWPSYGVSIFKKSHLRGRLEAMKSLNLQKKRSPYFPALILLILCVVSVTAVSFKTSAHGEEYATVIMKVFNDGGLDATPSIISKYGEKATVIVGNDEDNESWVLEVTPVRSGDMVEVSGFICLMGVSIDDVRGVNPSVESLKCLKKSKFMFTQKFGTDFRMSSPDSKLSYQFKVFDGARTKEYLNNNDRLEDSSRDHFLGYGFLKWFN